MGLPTSSAFFTPHGEDVKPVFTLPFVLPLVMASRVLPGHGHHWVRLSYVPAQCFCLLF